MNSSEINVLWGQAVSLGTNIAAAIVGHAVNAPTWLQTLPLILAPLIAAAIAFFHSHFAHKSYAAQLQAGILQSNTAPVAVGAGPPASAVVGPESVAGWENDTHVQAPQP